MTNQEFIESIALEGEEWRDVVGYEGRNLVSSFGRMITICPHHYKYKGIIPIRRIMKPYVAKDTGYEKVSLYKGGKRKTVCVHRIIAEAFLDNHNHLPEIDHINAIRTDNRVQNLKWCTRKENMNNPHALNAQSKIRAGKPTSRSRKIAQLKDGKLIRVYDYIYLATREGFSDSGIAHTLRGRQTTHKGYQWMYLSDYETQSVMSKNS